MTHHVRATLIFAAGIVLAVLVALALHNTGRIASNERHDTAALRAALYRICERSNVGRADLLSADITDKLTPDDNARELAAHELRLSLLDCSPNLVGKPALRLSLAQQNAFLHFYLSHNRPPRVRNGRIVPIPDGTEAAP